VKEKLPWWDRLNGALMPYIGPPALGPFDQEPLAPTGQKPCPICGAAMADHEIERSGGNTATRLHCPV
jgi:ribosomal protein S27AE